MELSGRWGAPQGVAYHGYFGQHQYHPLLVFDGHTGQIVTAEFCGRATPTLDTGAFRC
ncbi:MAG: hypothetical protein LC674_02730 [Actinobacteria bacterium]|nr:hypothetical protein [Actinomycetota bacterium]